MMIKKLQIVFMTKTYARACCLVMLLMLSAPVSAAGPSIIMIYGEPLRSPVFAVIRQVPDLATCAFLSCAASSSPNRPGGDGPHLKIAMFWGIDIWSDPGVLPELLRTLTPERANEHGRLYMPVGGERPRIVVTGTRLAPLRPGQSSPEFAAAPVPNGADEFERECHLTDRDVTTARGLRIPGV